MIEKPVIVITSLGRTGTLFFASLFNQLWPEATALHEPDYFNFGQYKGARAKLRETARQIGESGFANLVLRKMLGKWNLVALSDGRIKGRISREAAARQLRQQRAQFVAGRAGDIYVESSSAYYGLLDVLPLVFAHHRAVFIVRDGRDWVRSKMNWGHMYQKQGWRARISYTWPTALDFPDDPWRESWTKMSRFARICWAWAKLNSFALDTLSQNQDARVFRFEALFDAESGDHALAELVDFAGGCANIPAASPNALSSLLTQPTHQSQGAFPHWSAWDAAQRRQFAELCGPLMDRLGYVWDQANGAASF